MKFFLEEMLANPRHVYKGDKKGGIEEKDNYDIVFLSTILSPQQRFLDS